MTDTSQAPAFDVVLRGYDRAQVDDYLRQVGGQLEQAYGRALAAEREAAGARANGAAPAPAANPYAELGAQVTAVLQSAEDAARRIRAEADEYAVATRADADRYAERSQAQTDQQARETVATAGQEAARAQAAAAAARDEEQRLLADAKARAADLLARAQQRADDKAEETVSAADQEGAQVLAAARAQAEELVSRAARRTAELDAAVRQLEDRRLRTAREIQHLVRELHEVAAELGGGGLVDDSPTVEVRMPAVAERSRA